MNGRELLVAPLAHAVGERGHAHSPLRPSKLLVELEQLWVEVRKGRLAFGPALGERAANVAQLSAGALFDLRQTLSGFGQLRLSHRQARLELLPLLHELEDPVL